MARVVSVHYLHIFVVGPRNLYRGGIFTLDQIRIGVNENLCKRRRIDSLFAYFRDRPISDQIPDEWKFV